jgi:alpha-tubulin suppressor-like RCC1 family protein
VIAISAGANHSLALRSDGTIWAWGQFCGPSSANTNIAALYVFGTPGEITSISAGVGFSLFLKNDGTVWGWGNNTNGQLGPNNTGTIFPSVIQVTGISNVTCIAAGYSHSMAVRSDSTVWTWGTNTHGELGDGTLIEKHSPLQVIGLNKIISVAAGFYHSMALASDEKVWTWGWNNGDQLGVPNTTIMERLTPRAVVE